MATLRTIYPPYWARQGVAIEYPSLVQTGQSCVFLSIGSAVNWLTGSNHTEAELLRAFHAAGGGDVNFATAQKAFAHTAPQIKAAEFSDGQTLLPPPEEMHEFVGQNGVL